MSLCRLMNPVMPYAWGSRDGIARLQGRPAAEHPEAELWMGAHPRAASVLQSADGKDFGGPLDALIEADPEGVLGADVLARFGPRLPFMLKLLSAAQPLSLQVHPDDALAEERFAIEDAAGIDREAAERSYRDPHAKPEMLVAVSDFQALLGFRAATDAATALAALDLPRLEPVIARLRSGAPTGDAFLTLVDWPEADRRDLVGEVASAAAVSGQALGPWADWVTALAETYPADPGVVGVLLLNHVALAPGEAVYVEPGQIHAYLTGTGVEILGGSDNVVRGGLTPKHVAPEELRRVLSLDAAAPHLVVPVTQPDGEECWPTPRPEFALYRLRLDGETRELSARGPEILLCLEGKATVSAADDSVTLDAGDSAFATANTGAMSIVGHGVILRATTGTLLAEAAPATRSEA